MQEHRVSLENSSARPLGDLVQQAQAGSEEAFRAIYDLFSRRVFNLAYHLSGEYETARDLTQEIFLKAYEKLSSYRGEAGFATWLYRLALNTGLDFCRRRVRRQDLAAMAAYDRATATAADAESDYLENERRRLVRQAIAELKPKYRSVLVLKDVEGFSYPEMASILGCSEGTIASRLNKARKLLYEKLKRSRHRL